jgi:hypothetical protein
VLELFFGGVEVLSGMVMILTSMRGIAVRLEEILSVLGPDPVSGYPTSCPTASIASTSKGNSIAKAFARCDGPIP